MSRMVDSGGFTRVSLGVAVGASAVCLALLQARLTLAGAPTFSFLAWNLLLAWVPLLAALAIRALPRSGSAGPPLAALGALWLLFLPNAPYLLTDLIHLAGRPPGSPALDYVMFPAFAVTGMLIGVLSLHLVHARLERRHGPRWAWSAVIAAIGLAGFGMYLGRILQWNSWDMLTRPGERAGALWERLGDPWALVGAGAVTAVCAGCLLVAYGWFRLVGRRALNA
jgi:uncharacterized membrane protein